MDATIRARLFMAVTAYDVAASKRKGYNPHALGHYARALGNVAARVELGHDLRAAIITEFLGALCDKLLRAVGLAVMSDAEARHGLAVRLPELPEVAEVE